MIVILIEMIRLHLKANKHLDQSVIAQFKYILRQAITVFHWITGGKSKKGHKQQPFEDLELSEDNGGIIEIRQIHSSLAKHPKTLEISNQSVLPLKILSKAKKMRPSREDWLGNTIQTGLDSQIHPGTNRGFSNRQNHSLRISPRLSEDSKRILTSHRLSSKKKARVNIPNLNFSDRMTKRAKRLSSLDQSFGLKDMAIKGKKTLAKERQELRDKLLKIRNEDLP
ncbi:unnamed protein product [Moneuplotes crassus]|uniref:Uncharacterized protein n=1 Tax=Euplotes crassus TaxID=5936 RepID=A0AAD1YB08_EUPCR|nr:unnamed protein product [Moneuplotes crassus]